MVDSRLNRDSSNEPTDVEKIVAYGGTLEDAGATDIFTYVANQECKGGPTKKPFESLAHAQQGSTGNSPSQGFVTLTSTVGKENPSQEANPASVFPQINHVPRPFIPPHQQLPRPQTQVHSSPVSQEYQSSFCASGESAQQEFGTVGSLSRTFLSTGDVTLQNQMNATVNIPVGQSTGGFVDGVMDEDIADSIDLWWDQAYETSDMDRTQLNQILERGAYPFGTLFFG